MIEGFGGVAPVWALSRIAELEAQLAQSREGQRAGAEELARVTRERDEAKVTSAAWHEGWQLERARAEQAEAQCAALDDYVNHTDDCNAWCQDSEGSRWLPESRKCSCGLDSLSANLPAAAQRLLAAQELAETLRADWGNWSSDAVKAFGVWRALG